MKGFKITGEASWPSMKEIAETENKRLCRHVTFEQGSAGTPELGWWWHVWGAVDPDSLNPDPTPGFLVNPDPDSDPGF
jgi:hypothetical protein